MKKELIKVDVKRICGIKNPNLVITGSVYVKNPTFKLIVDKKEVDPLIRINSKDFVVERALSKKDKKIELYLVLEGKDVFVCKLKNGLFSRIGVKILSILKKIGRVFYKILRAIKRIFVMIYKGIRLAWREHHFLIPPALWGKYFKAFVVKIKNLFKDTPYYDPFVIRNYHKWLDIQEPIIYNDLEYNPLISVIIPVYNVKGELLSTCLDSVLNNHYQNFEICLADDCSTNQDTIDTLKRYEEMDDRIKVVYRKKNGHISEATNSAISIASGEFIALLDNDDLITEDALYLFAEALNKNKKLDIIYTDEDKMNPAGERCEPFFKPDWSPDTLLSFNYITHFCLYRKSLVEELGGFRSEYNGAQDFDMILRATEKTNNIYHIPHITYHWRQVEGSTALKMSSKNYALEAGKKAIEDALRRRNIKANVIIPTEMAHYIVEYLYDKEPKISIIIPTKDYADILDTCLKSIYEKTDYKNYEIIVINNSSQKKETFELFDKYTKEHDNFKVIDANMEFNYSKINNIGVNEATGDYVVLLNNDTEVLTSNWLHSMVGYAMQDHIGAVGAKLLYPDNTIQHCGVILGIAGTAGHFGFNIKDEDNGPFARYMAPYNYAAVTAACLMISKKKYLEIGGLDEELKVAFNDIEFNVRLLKAGYYNVCLPHVKLHHYESKTRGLDTTGEKYKRFLIESDLLRRKCGNYIERDPFYNDNLSRIHPMMLDTKKKK